MGKNSFFDFLGLTYALAKSQMCYLCGGLISQWWVTFGYNDFLTIEWDSFTSPIWLAFLFVIICTTFLAYLLNIYGLKELNPTVVSSYIYSQPLIATLFALLLSKDELSWVKVVAAAAIFTGVYLVSKKKKVVAKVS